MSADFQEWTCHARPSGQKCGHVNTVPHATNFHGERLIYCGHCGRTKHASDDRLKREQEGRK